MADACAVCRSLQASLDLSAPLVKADESPVTVADFAAQAIVARRLADALGPVRLVAEETSAFLRDPAHAPALGAALEALRPVWPDATPDALLSAIDLGSPARGAQPPVDASAFFTLDPIDGTKGFLRRRQYSICLALIERGTATLGALGCPNLPLDPGAPLDRPDPAGAIYAADVPARLVLESIADGAAPARPLPPLPEREAGDGTEAPADRPVTVVTSVEPSHSSRTRLLAVLTALGRPFRLVPLDSQCKYALVARGQADAMLRLPSRRDAVYHVWDHAPGAAVAGAAGCVVTDLVGRPLDFAAGVSLANNIGILCAAPWLHPLLVEAVERAGVVPA